MLAYVFWHRPAAGVERGAYEQALTRFHRSLARRPPSGLRESASARLAEAPWPAAGANARTPVYEDWYVIGDWTALGVLEEAALSRGHVTAHDAVASRTGTGVGGVYRLLEGGARPAAAQRAVWVTPAPGRERLSLETLLGDGIDPERDGLWRRCLALGPAPEYCLLTGGAGRAPAGAAATRLPRGWTASDSAREPVWGGTSG